MFIPERIIDQKGVSIAATAHFCPATTELIAEWQECKALPELLGRKVSDGGRSARSLHAENSRKRFSPEMRQKEILKGPQKIANSVALLKSG